MKNIFKGTNSNAYWYRKIGTNGDSVAVDDLDRRADINGNANEDSYKTTDLSKDKDGDGFIDQDVLKKEPISAYTPSFKIDIENKEDKEETKEIKENEEDKNFKSNYVINDINFGIIDTPKISLGFEKVMTNIRVTNTVGQVIIDGNPGNKDQNIKYLSNLDSKTNHLAGKRK